MSARLPVNLMLVEDERIVAFDLKRQLQGFGYHVGAVVASGEQAVGQMAAEKPDLVLMDIHLEGRMDGIEAAIAIRARHQTPVVFLTAYAEDDTLRRALESRPFGYLVKPCEGRELHATIQMALARREDEIALEQSVKGNYEARQQLHHLAHHDPLTGLPNRLLFDDRLQYAIEQARRNEQRCLLLFLDLDGFKVINDTLGHAFGDELLRRVAERLKAVLRASDTIARLGGDEFVILAGSANSDYAAQLAQKILDQLRVPMAVLGETLAITGSVGIAVFPDNGADSQQLLRAADMAMYTAKAEGRNRHRFYADDVSPLLAHGEPPKR